MNERDKIYRENIIYILRLISSKERQLKYQQDVPYAMVSAELFCMWDERYIIADDSHNIAFSQEELLALKKFNKVFDAVADQTLDSLPDIEVFIETEHWLRLSEAALEALKKMNMPKLSIVK